MDFKTINKPNLRVPSMRILPVVLGIAIGTVCFFGHSGLSVRAQDKKAGKLQQFTYRAIGLFSPERENDLKEAFSKIPNIKLIQVDYQSNRFTVEHDPARTWPGEMSYRYTEIIHGTLQNVSRGSFGARALPEKPLDQLQIVEIPVVGLDCKGCALGACRLIHQLPGVETVTVDFVGGKIRARVDPNRANRAALEKALKQGGVEIPETAQKTSS